eukprot:GAFH01002233.1.p2 GENE.GAFH01002233.1~~GAFH01002233.1.p2  ORF type:complete len:178 (+),score=30.31 GAFH01002233.1:166-699(+)
MQQSRMIREERAARLAGSGSGSGATGTPAKPTVPREPTLGMPAGTVWALAPPVAPPLGAAARYMEEQGGPVSLAPPPVLSTPRTPASTTASTATTVSPSLGGAAVALGVIPPDTYRSQVSVVSAPPPTSSAQPTPRTPTATRTLAAAGSGTSISISNEGLAAPAPPQVEQTMRALQL